MSGGLFNYEDASLCHELFHGENPSSVNSFNASRRARHDGPFKGELFLNEQLWDMFCLLHEYDWYMSGDTGPDSWEEAKKTYYAKWGKGSTEHKKQLVEEECDRLKAFLLEGISDA